MVTIQTTAHIGPDGLLRLEVPCPHPDRDVHVVLLVSEQPVATGGNPTDDPWRDLRERLARDSRAAAGIHIPPPGSWNLQRPNPVRVDDGSSASEQLVRDRR